MTLLFFLFLFTLCVVEACKAVLLGEVHYYGLAAAQGYNYAMYRLGYFYMIGLGVKQDDALAAHWLREAAEIGYCWGMPQYFYGRYYAPDAEVETWLLRAAAAGCKMAYTELGNKFLTGTAEGNFPLNADSAFHYFSLGADNGDADAFYWLSQCYANGRGCTQSYARAHTLFEQAEQSGSYMARLFRRLNADRQQPQGTRDPSQGGQLTFADDAAYDWYCDACLNQRPQSMYRLARSYLHGTNGVSANAHESGYWMGMAAYGGLVEAQYFLALYFEQSDNPTRAAEWYERGSHSTQYLTDETSYAEYLDLVATCAAALKRLEAKE
mgnify:CR=1 FL=1